MVGSVRRFNRTVTQRIGALDDSFLARGRPLSQARVLWEIGPDGTSVRALRSRLGLDSGYLSRILRALEADGLIAVGADQRDRRVRAVRLTAAGRAERGELDRRSDDMAAEILRPLTARQRERLACGRTTPSCPAGSTAASTRRSASRPATMTSRRRPAFSW
jgi:DNA-binding MarR family transcriptional regulator